MVYGLLSNLAAVALAVHVLLGCCWHHRHTCRHAAADARSVHLTIDECHSHRCRQEHRRPHEPAGGDRHGGDGCDGGRCVFVTDQSVRAPTASLTQFREALTAAVTVNDGLPVRSNLRVATFAALGRCPPLPTYLLHQVFLL